MTSCSHLSRHAAQHSGVAKEAYCRGKEMRERKIGLRQRLRAQPCPTAWVRGAVRPVFVPGHGKGMSEHKRVRGVNSRELGKLKSEQQIKEREFFFCLF